MTASAHSHYNYNRRHSTATPYTIPMKHQYQHSGNNSAGTTHSHPHGHHQYMHSQSYSSHHYGHEEDEGSRMSTSVPTLSREFVVRRISEGETGRLKEELKCEACGKGYKHISSLAKHLWEHTPEWNVTKKLLISKHQQVQLLEAASILVGMNDNKSRRNSVFDEPTDKKSRANSVSVYPPISLNTPKQEPGVQMGGFLEDRRTVRDELLLPKKPIDYVEEGIIGQMD